MTTIHRPRVSGSGLGWPAFAGVGVGVSMILTALGTFTNLAGAEEGDNGFAEWLVVVGMTLVVAAIAFALVARLVTPANAATFAVVFGALAVVSVTIFWSGAPAVLAAAAFASAAAARDDDGLPKTAMAGQGLALAALLFAIVLAIYG